jgi:hypothetical protein
MVIGHRIDRHTFFVGHQTLECFPCIVQADEDHDKDDESDNFTEHDEFLW